MQIPSTVSIWLGEQVAPLGCVALLLLLVLVSLAASAHERRRFLNEARANLSEDTFVESLLLYGFDPIVSRTTYRYLRMHQNVLFPIHPSDRLDEDLGLGLEDVDETVRNAVQLAGRIYRPGLQSRPLVTVEDLVRLVQACPRSFGRAA